MSEQLFYLQDSRGYVGNDVLWWAKNGAGYTTDLNKAEVYSFEKAQAQHNCRETDIPWPKEYIDQRTRPAVDMQYIDHDEALAGTGIAIRKPEMVRHKKEVFNCHNCGRFISEQDRYMPCRHCEADNRP